MPKGRVGVVQVPRPRFRRQPTRVQPAGGTAWGNSRWTTLGRCPRKYYNAHVLGMHPAAPRKGLDRGTAVHKGWELYHKGRSRAQVLDAVEETAVGTEARAQALRMIEWYMDEFPRSAFRVINDAEVVHQAAFEIALPGGEVVSFSLTTRYDVLGVPRDSDRDGEVQWIDLKTQTDFSGERMLRYMADPQLMQGVAIWEKAGPPKGLRRARGARLPKRLIPQIFVIHESSKLRRIAEHHANYYVPTWQINSLLQLRAFELAHVLGPLEQLYGKETPWPQRWGNCFDQYGACEYFDHCHTNGAARDLYYLEEGHHPRWATVEGAKEASACR